MERLTMLIDSHLLDNGKLYREYDLNNKIQLNEYSCMDIPNAVYNKLGELEDVLEEFELTSAEDLRNFLNFKGNMAIWEGELNYKNKIADLEQELAELKQNAIVPKFKVGQTLFRMDFGSIVPFLVNEIYGHIKADKTISIQYFDYVGLVIEENELFAIREEAEQKLAEIREREDESK